MILISVLSQHVQYLWRARDAESASRVGEKLEQQGLIVRDCENAYLALDPADSVPMHDLIGHSITYRVATGPRAGQKVFTLQTLPPDEELLSDDRLARASGFSLHAGVSVEGDDRTKLEHLVRYVARPALAVERLSVTPAGNIRYTLKTPYRDGTTAVMFEPFDFLARLAALVPLPGVHFTRYHGVFAPASALRGAVTPAGRGRGAPPEHMSAPPQPDKHVSMNWMQRLKRVFSIDIQTCQRCGGALKVIASIEDRVLIDHILAHLEQRAEHEAIVPFPSRGPPQPLLL
ncbi:MAG TPA: transposase [Steroidobacteraceae bacterium]